MSATEKKIMRVIAHWELAEGAEASIPGMQGFAKAYLAKMGKEDLRIIQAYRREKAAISGDLANMLEAHPPKG